MNFKYTCEWKEKLLNLSKLKYMTKKEEIEFSRLIDFAEYTQDPRVVKVLIKILNNDDLGGMEQSIYSTLSTVDYSVYYKEVFVNSQELLEKNPRGACDLLDWQWKELDKNELIKVFEISKQTLDVTTMEKYINTLEKFGYCDDKPYSSFITYFNQIIKDQNE